MIRLPRFYANRRSGVWLRWAGVGVVAGVAVAAAGWFALRWVPLPSGLFTPPRPEGEFTDRFGRALRAARSADEAPYRRPASYAEIPLPLVEATLAAEDGRFWRHPGVDWRATVRAAWQWAVHRRVISGGSTITQQVIKLAQPRRRTLRAKFVEALQALRLEQVWDKPAILAAYLNRIDYGNFNTGCGAAASYYFGKPLRDLSAAECALLAALPQAPTRLNPRRHFERARKRQQWILNREFAHGWLARDQLERARVEPLRLAAPRRTFEAPHFVDLVLQQGGARAGAGMQPSRSSIRTTLDLELNRFVEQTIRQRLGRLRDHQVGNAAAVVIDNCEGDVLALVGSGDYFAPGSGQVNGAWAPRSAGSAFKPFTYLLAFERGATPASVAADVPAEFATATGLFAPVNYNHRCAGPIRYRLALANSLNIPAVKVLLSVGGPEPLLRRLRDCGLTTLTRAAEDYGLGLTLGNAEARLIELANAYACLARLGVYRPYRLLLDEPAGPSRRVTDPGSAWLIADILADNAARSLAFGADSSLKFDFPVACKTGTSSNFRDNWAFGFTPEFTVGVWVGNFDATPMREVSGVTGAAPILHEVFERLRSTRGVAWYAAPADLVVCEVDPITGKRLRQIPGSPHGPGALEKFLVPPPFEAPGDYDAAGRVRLGGEYREWLASPDNRLADRAVLAESSAALRILFPPPGTTFYLDPDLPGQGRRVAMRADGPAGLRWRSDSLRIEPEGGRTIARFTEGRHQISVSDPLTGAEAQTWIEVLAR